jgi:Cof subfamily protein (haloacid dehalogenase superfamily)
LLILRELRGDYMQPPLALVACDVDGTLLRDDEKVSARSRLAVQRVCSSGIAFVLVTGRSPRWVAPVVEQIPEVTYAICSNGAVSCDMRASKVLSTFALLPAELASIIKSAEQVLPNAAFGVERVLEGNLIQEGSQFFVEPSYSFLFDGTPHQLVSRDGLSNAPAVKLVLRDAAMKSDEMVIRLDSVFQYNELQGTKFVATFSHPDGLVEIAPSGVTKTLALRNLADSLKITAEEVIAFGDMPNDIPMLKWAGYAVAMRNSHPSVIEIADEVTAGNNDDGVAVVLERWLHQ